MFYSPLIPYTSSEPINIVPTTTMSHVHNVTVPYVDTAHFDWSFTRTGPLPWNSTVWSLLAVFTALPLWMTIELTVWVFYTFTKYRGLYFLSVLATTWGVTLHAIGFILKFCVPSCNWIFSTTLAEIGWVGMVSGFSVVLYSRLHLVVRSQRVLRFVLVMIIVDALLFHVPTIVFQYGTSNKATHKKFIPFMAPMERVQVMGFSIQETIISAIYIHATIQMLKTSSAFNKKIRTTIAFLIIIQIIVILSDVLVIALDYAEYFTLKAVIHSFVYAGKLQLEFVILNEFKSVSKGLASRGIQVLADDGNAEAALPREKKSSGSGSQKWWRSRDASSETVEDNQVMGGDRIAGSSDVSTIGHAVSVVDGVDGAGASNGFRPYVAGVTDTVQNEEDLDMERQYLGAWDRVDRRS